MKAPEKEILDWVAGRLVARSEELLIWAEMRIGFPFPSDLERKWDWDLGYLMALRDVKEELHKIIGPIELKGTDDADTTNQIKRADQAGAD